MRWWIGECLREKSDFDDENDGPEVNGDGKEVGFVRLFPEVRRECLREKASDGIRG